MFYTIILCGKLNKRLCNPKFMNKNFQDYKIFFLFINHYLFESNVSFGVFVFFYIPRSELLEVLLSCIVKNVEGTLKYRISNVIIV